MAEASFISFCLFDKKGERGKRERKGEGTEV